MAGTGAIAPNLRRYLIPSERLVAEVHWHPVWLLRSTLVLLGVLARDRLAGRRPRRRRRDRRGARAGAARRRALVRLAVPRVAHRAPGRHRPPAAHDQRADLAPGGGHAAAQGHRHDVHPAAARAAVRHSTAGAPSCSSRPARTRRSTRSRSCRSPDELYRCLTNEIFGENGIYGRKPPPAAGPASRSPTGATTRSSAQARCAAAVAAAVSVRAQQQPAGRRTARAG